MNDSEKRQTAKKCEKTEDAELIYEDLWNRKGDNWDKWLGWEYASVLKKLHKNGKAIEVCNEIYEKDSKFKYNNDLLSWLLFEEHIRPVSIDSSYEEIKSMITTAEFIVSSTVHNGKKTAFESTVFKLLDILKSQNNVNWNEILKWVNKLNHNSLSDEVITYNLHDGREKEGASRKEAYFSIKTKALEKTGNYADCIIWCNLGLEAISKLHFENDIWFDVRRNYCNFMISLDGNSLDNLIELSEKKRHWTIYNKIFNCYCKIEDHKNSLIYGAKALLTNDPIKMKVSLLYDFAIELEKAERIKDAAVHFALTAQIRKNNQWNINSSLNNKLIKYEIEEGYDVRISDLHNFWIELVKSDEKIQRGKILSIMPHGNSGFISGDDGNNYFFKKSSLLFGKNIIHIGIPVSFRIIKSFDPRKQKESKEAVEITFDN